MGESTNKSVCVYMLRDKGNREVEGMSRLFEELDQCLTLWAKEYADINAVYRTTVPPVDELKKASFALP